SGSGAQTRLAIARSQRLVRQDPLQTGQSLRSREAAGTRDCKKTCRSRIAIHARPRLSTTWPPRRRRARIRRGAEIEGGAVEERSPQYSQAMTDLLQK